MNKLTALLLCLCLVSCNSLIDSPPPSSQDQKIVFSETNLISEHYDWYVYQPDDLYPYNTTYYPDHEEVSVASISPMDSGNEYYSNQSFGISYHTLNNNTYELTSGAIVPESISICSPENNMFYLPLLMVTGKKRHTEFQSLYYILKDQGCYSKVFQEIDDTFLQDEGLYFLKIFVYIDRVYTLDTWHMTTFASNLLDNSHFDYSKYFGDFYAKQSYTGFYSIEIKHYQKTQNLMTKVKAQTALYTLQLLELGLTNNISKEQIEWVKKLQNEDQIGWKLHSITLINPSVFGQTSFENKSPAYYFDYMHSNVISDFKPEPFAEKFESIYSN